MSKKQRAAMLMEAAKRVHRGDSWHSCSSIYATSGEDNAETAKYADYVGVVRYRSAFGLSSDYQEYSSSEQQLTRELAILMYREAVLAGEV